MTEGETRESRDTLTASPWGTQESGARGLRVDAQAGGSEGRKAPSGTANEAGTWDHHGALSLRAILAAGAGGRSARGGASGRRGPQGPAGGGEERRRGGGRERGMEQEK